MRKDIHPKLYEAEVVCMCDNKWTTLSTKEKLTVEYAVIVIQRGRVNRELLILKVELIE